MKLSRALVACIPIFALALADARDAAACGGCFVPEEESTQVTGHKMIVSISTEQTTLWDQITYAGDPASFAWVLPIKKQVEIGLSSDALFAFLGDQTRVNVSPPPLNCPEPPPCAYSDGDAFGSAAGSSGATGAGGGSGGVEVIAQEVVGPYETVQLSADDPAALQTWLTDHGYAVPADIAPIINAYVQEGYDFLALKLVPGQGIESMRPVRVTSPGAGVGLPLRMVAAGTGAITPLTLWVLGEGRYETANFPSFTIAESDVIWDWTTSDSNYAQLQQKGFDASNGFGWLTEAAFPMSTYALESTMTQVVENIPEQSGYGDGMPDKALEEVTADLDKLFGTLDQASVWISRLHGELTRPALAKDLKLGASMTQTEVSNFIQTKKSIGTPPPCPVYNCDDTNSGSTTGDPFDGIFGTGDGDDGPSSAGDAGSCAVGTTPGVGGLGVLGVALAVTMARRRRRGR